MRIPLIYGLITGLAISAWMLLEFYAGFHETKVGQFSGYFSLVFAAAGIYLCIKKFRENSGGYISFGRAVYVGFIMSIYAGLIISVFTYLYYEVINPDFTEFMAEQARQQLLKQNATDPEIKQAMQLTRENYQAVPQSLNGLGGFMALGILISIFAALILKRKPPFSEA